MPINWGLQQCVLLVAWVAQVARIPAVDLHLPKTLAIDERMRGQLSDASLKILGSSNFNSRNHPGTLRRWTPRRIHADYREVVSGPHLVVSFDEPRRVGTIGGQVEVIDIVIGLGLRTRDSQGRAYPGPLYTIDAEGRVVRHEKWSGEFGLELLRLIQEATRPA
jgi:hypothetical protein